MLTHDEIQRAVAHIAPLYSIRKASYFGSYAMGKQTGGSDLDLLVEFDRPSVSLFVISGVKASLEDALHIPVDVIHAPLPPNALIRVERQVPVYGGSGWEHE